MELCDPKSNFTEISLIVPLTPKPSIEIITIKFKSPKI